jgi:hypothetical protein
MRAIRSHVFGGDRRVLQMSVASATQCLVVEIQGSGFFTNVLIGPFLSPVVTAGRAATFAGVEDSAASPGERGAG